MSDYKIYHDTYSSVIMEAEKYAEMNGYEVGSEGVDTFTGGVSYGHTKRLYWDMLRDGKDANQLNIQIYRLDSGKYELNMYFSKKVMADGGHLKSELKALNNLLQKHSNIKNKESMHYKYGGSVHKSVYSVAWSEKSKSGVNTRDFDTKQDADKFYSELIKMPDIELVMYDFEQYNQYGMLKDKKAIKIFNFKYGEDKYAKGGSINVDSLNVGDKIGFLRPRTGRYEYADILSIEGDNINLVVRHPKRSQWDNYFTETKERVKKYTNTESEDWKDARSIMKIKKFADGGSVDNAQMKE